MSLALEIEVALMRTAGPLLTGEFLANSLGYPSATAFKKALERKTVPVVIFTIPRRRGQYALSRDVALWLAEQRERSGLTKKNTDEEEVDSMP